MLSWLSLEPCMREMFRSSWKNAIRWACLTGDFTSKYCFPLLIDGLWNIFLISSVVISIATLAVAQNMRELYRLVLVDTPLAPYFSECITSEVQSSNPCLTHLLHPVFFHKHLMVFLLYWDSTLLCCFTSAPNDQLLVPILFKYYYFLQPDNFDLLVVKEGCNTRELRRTLSTVSHSNVDRKVTLY